jgi:phage terminase large subunit
MITATQELEDIITYAVFRVGCDPDQLERFINFGYIPQAKQMEFHAVARAADQPGGPERIGYGGTRGQAKSHAILAQVGMDDCQRFPGLKVLYLRNIGKAAAEQFEDLITKLFSLVPHTYKSSRGMLHFPNGSRVVLGGFRDESEIDAYIGIEYDLIVIEDATTLSETKYEAICGSLRTSKPGWRPRLYASANPGGVGHAWFKRIFVDPWIKGTEILTRFIHTIIGDNVFIDEGYARYLNGLTGWLRRAWRDGDFTIAAGQFFTNFDPIIHVIDPFPIPSDWTLWASMDYGFVHWNMIYILAQDGDGNRYVIDEYATRRTLVPQVAEGFRAMLDRNEIAFSRLEQFVAGSDIFAQRGTTQTIAEEYSNHGIDWEPAQTDRINGAAKVMTYLGGPALDPPIPPRLFIFNVCHRLIECLPMMQHDPRRSEDVLKWDCNSETGEGGDDPYDCLRYGMMTEGGMAIAMVKRR